MFRKNCWEVEANKEPGGRELKFKPLKQIGKAAITSNIKKGTFGKGFDLQWTNNDNDANDDDYSDDDIG